MRKYRKGENPDRWKGHLDKVLAASAKIQKVEHHPAIPVDGMPLFMQYLHTRTGIATRAQEYLILTATRSGEVRGARWLEVDLDKAIWTNPVERMQAGAEHQVPLSDAALKLRKDAPALPGSALFFPGSKGQSMSDMTMTAVIMYRKKVTAVPPWLQLHLPGLGRRKDQHPPRSP